MKKTVYSKKRRYEKGQTIYGIVLNEQDLKHYCFNRNYIILPTQLSKAEVEQLKRKAVNTDDRHHGHGPLKPLFNKPEGLKTYWLFDDSCTPKWLQIGG